ncbi:CHAT domain-containing protein [Fulvivirga lutimaris]|uniref:CHAT domain-containing protein n=1 Tax=Fulvivirga lutimaris TaxID=1819566 RepID=UPI0012BBF3B3|nr:CHAT domain-containing protein [Fulvivirga lutimaris]MTI38347.1 CHAT domain-containing protein [Fulvivirga lutimaris]
MKLIAPLLICISLYSYGQNRTEFYNQIEQFIDNDQLEEVVALESQVAINTAVLDTLSADIFSIFGETYLGFNDFEKAITYYEKALKVREQLNPLETTGYSNVLYNLTDLYLEMGKFPKSIQAGDKLLAVDSKLFGTDSDVYLGSVLFYADIFIETGKYSDALSVLNKQLKISKSDDYAVALLNAKKGDVLSLLGNYDDSKELLDEASSSFSGFSDTLNFELTQVALGLNYINQGKYPIAESIFLQAKSNLSLMNDTEFVINDIDNNLAVAQMALGRSTEAISVYKDLLSQDSTTFGKVHPNYLTSLINIGTAYTDTKNYELAENSLKEALEISAQLYEEESEVTAQILNNLANVYREKGQYNLAITTLDRSRKITEKVEGKKSANYANTIFNIGKTELLQNASSTEKTLQEALKLRKSILGENHPKYAEVTNYLALYYWKKNDLKNSRKYFEKTFENFFEQIKLFFPSLSEEEKTKFYLEKLRPTFEQYNSLAAQIMTSEPDILGQLYNYQLRTKGIIMVATERLRRNIYNSNDSSLIEDFNAWKSTKERLSKLYSNNDPRQSLVDSLNESANQIERSLVSRSSQFAQIYNEEIPDWKKVQASLKEDETAVEIIRYRVSDPGNGGAFNDEVHYLALIIDVSSEFPRSVKLTRGNLMEGRYLNNYRNSIRYQIEDNYTYNELWAPLESQFKGVKKLYISPDGVYNQINLSTLVNPNTSEYLIKEIEIQEVTSTRDIFPSSNFGKSSESKYLLGFPAYTLAKKEKSAESGVKRSLRGVDFSETRGLRGGLLRYMRSGEGIAELPGTKTEVEEITKIYEDQGIAPNTLTTSEASESKLKEISNPGILHIATHGYFLENVKSPDFEESNRYYQNPLLRAGIILAGAEDFLISGSNPIDNEDGILTAYEAMNMDLNNTELVVLSACETGLGEVSNGEGVYGLQRAFKIAGARYLVMSMWNVDDDATQRLMTLFYENLAQGKEKYYAFRDAQLALMKEYPEPFYWGAFKIVGE